MNWFTRLFQPKPQPVARQVLSSAILETRLRGKLLPVWDQRTLCVPTENAYITPTKSEIAAIGRKAWFEWREGIGGGICEVQCFAVLVEAHHAAVRAKINGRFALYSALTRGDRPHAYIIAETSATEVLVWDQTAQDFVEIEEMDRPIRIIYA